ncbi:RNA polymerase sigma factor sigF, chloroplastic [Tanacetum coccineum]
MEAAASSNMLSSSLSLPPRTHLKQLPHPPSALKLYEPAASTHSSMLATTLAQHFPTSVLIQEQRRESKPLSQTLKDDKTSPPMDAEVKQVIALAKKALSASIEAASLVDDSESVEVDLDNSVASRELLSSKEELELIANIKGGMKLEEARRGKYWASSKCQKFKPTRAVVLLLMLVGGLVSQVRSAILKLFQVISLTRRCIYFDVQDQAGMTVEKLQKLRSIQKITLSLQKPVWANDSTTYECLKPEMRKKSNLDEVGIGCEVRKSLADIGIMLGVSKERIRQVESRALFKLKQYSESHGLDAYKELLI